MWRAARVQGCGTRIRCVTHLRDPRLGEASIVDLFAGPGGLDVAARWMGVPTVGIEWDENACATRRAAGLSTIQGDVRAFGPSDFSNATMLAAGPPCQTYTVAGKGAGRRSLEKILAWIERLSRGDDITRSISELDDERTGLVLEPLRWILEAEQLGRPYEAIVLEQVPAVLPIWNAVAGVLADKGYDVQTGILRSEEFGVPQTRRRAVMIASTRAAVVIPTATHRRYFKGRARFEGDSNLHPWRTMGETLARQSAFIVVSNYGSGGDPKARGRRTSDLPSATVTGKVFRNRLLSAAGRELARFSQDEAGQLQTFPPDFPWRGKDIAQQIGNAIPPRLAVYVIASALDLVPAVWSLDSAAQTSWLTASDGIVEMTGGGRPTARAAGADIGLQQSLYRV
ncbi:DNA cytosine methyltransferase [Rhodococcus sp. G-MC3]|uniref:DNA cytosine methyltransferase n=1 Tax=Rhodococcus sp. G-MC3 TaxID=3046209 RepID=UPI0024BB5103|nr:DNA cytosine methyltransferase [Rhodococcus sp. G-MC3]MDJ0395013.1 DNA cytosine methyltransferase [Rhodococcus sp. G-MC3]